MFLEMNIISLLLFESKSTFCTQCGQLSQEFHFGHMISLECNKTVNNVMDKDEFEARNKLRW